MNGSITHSTEFYALKNKIESDAPLDAKVCINALYGLSKAERKEIMLLIQKIRPNIDRELQTPFVSFVLEMVDKVEDFTPEHRRELQLIGLRIFPDIFQKKEPVPMH